MITDTQIRVNPLLAGSEDVRVQIDEQGYLYLTDLDDSEVVVLNKFQAITLRDLLNDSPAIRISCADGG